MHFYMWLALLLMCTSSCIEGSVLSRSNSLAKLVHHSALKRGAGFAHDFRIAMAGILGGQRTLIASSKRGTYCVAKIGASSFQGSGSGNASMPSPSATSTSLPSSSPASSSSSLGTSSSHGGSSTSTSASNLPSSTPASSNWNLAQTYTGNSFFDGWAFWNLPDPTYGIVNYLSQADAQANNLIGFSSAGNALMKVDTTQTVTDNRNSVRIGTDLTWTGGLFIMDSVHMPTGCGTWPGFWSTQVGPSWPAAGEIDIIEGVNDDSANQATVHTVPGCSLSTSSSSTLSMTGTLVTGTDCSSGSETGTVGCGIRSTSDMSYGAAFNGNGGGVYAMQWDSSGISVYFFPRNQIPVDITVNAPQPTNWGNPMANWPASNCDPYKYFYDHSFIFDTTLCGAWASGAWDTTGVPGQDQSCAARTGYSTCEQFVRSSGSSFTEAYWEIKSFQIYQPK